MLALLRNEHAVPLRELRDGGECLARYSQEPTPWGRRCFWVTGRHVVDEDLTSGALVAGRPQGQVVIPIDLHPIARATDVEAHRRRRRSPMAIGMLARHRCVAHNAWVVARTRIPTSAIWAFPEAGYDEDGVIREYPLLEPEDRVAAIAHERALRDQAAA